MRDFGSGKKSPAHDNKRIQLFPFDNFPADPTVGELVYYKSSSTSGIFIFNANKVWEKIQTIDSTIISMGAEFPQKMTPATLFYNNMADVDDLEEGEQQLYGFYYVSDSGDPVKLLDVNNHLHESDPHSQYMQVNEAISTFQPLKITQTVSASMQTKMLLGENSLLNAFKTPIPISAGMYKVECVVWTDSPGVFLLTPDFGHTEKSEGLCIQNKSMITYTTYVEIKDDTNIVPKMLISYAPSSGYKGSSMNVLPGSFISFDLMY